MVMRAEFEVRLFEGGQVKPADAGSVISPKSDAQVGFDGVYMHEPVEASGSQHLF